MSIRIIIAEDHPTVRAGLRALLQLCPNVKLVAEASNGEQVLRAIERHQPDIVLMDVSLPRMDGLTTAARVRERFPSVRIIMLSLQTQVSHIREAIRAGVSGFLLKNLADELEPALHAVARGGTYFSPAISQALPSVLRPSLIRETDKDILTPRQEEILRLIARGFTTKEIAQKLGISVKTAQTHRTQLMKRLDIHDVAGLVRYAIRTGLATSEK